MMASVTRSAERNQRASPDRKTQRGRILARLLEARGGEVPAPELARLGGLQFQTRIYELKHQLDFKIENRMETVDGKKLSWYRLVSSPDVPATPPPVGAAPEQAAFPEFIQPRSEYPD
jgi:hypothetical protein